MTNFRTFLTAISGIILNIHLSFECEVLSAVTLAMRNSYVFVEVCYIEHHTAIRTLCWAHSELCVRNLRLARKGSQMFKFFILELQNLGWENLLSLGR
jgi:uncharacterized MAPEG superfamily protein